MAKYGATISFVCSSFIAFYIFSERPMPSLHSAWFPCPTV